MNECINDDDYKNNSLERRTQVDKRSLVDEFLANGWEIISRDPLRLQRGRNIKVFRKGILIDEG